MARHSQLPLAGPCAATTNTCSGQPACTVLCRNHCSSQRPPRRLLTAGVGLLCHLHGSVLRPTCLLAWLTRLPSQIVNETLPTLLSLRAEGRIRAIGITGYPLDIFSYVLDRWGADNSSCHGACTQEAEQTLRVPPSVRLHMRGLYLRQPSACSALLTGCPCHAVG